MTSYVFLVLQIYCTVILSGKHKGCSYISNHNIFAVDGLVITTKNVNNQVLITWTTFMCSCVHFKSWKKSNFVNNISEQV